MKYADIKNLSEKEIRSKMKETRVSMFDAQMKNVMGQLTNPLSIRQMRRDVARLQTALRTASKKA